MFLLYKGGRIHYSDMGAGNTIVLLHGYLESSEVWKGFMVKLASGYRVIAIDLPGHGLSDIVSETHSMEYMAGAVSEVITSLGIRKVFMTGHSLGGYVTLAFLDLYPDMLSGYCLFHSHPFADPPEAIEKRKREIAIVRAGKKDLMYPDNVTKMFAPSNLSRCHEALERLKRIASEIPGEGIIAVLNGMIIRPSRLTLMEEGRVPCLWILGLMDSYIRYNKIMSGVKLPANASTVVLQNSGHIGFIEEEDHSVDAMTAFVNKNCILPD